jgi:hypothetical protein
MRPLTDRAVAAPKLTTPGTPTQGGIAARWRPSSSPGGLRVIGGYDHAFMLGLAERFMALQAERAKLAAPAG